MATKPQDAPICPGSAIYPDIINDPLVGQPTYVCAACGASVPNLSRLRSTGTPSPRSRVGCVTHLPNQRIASH